MPSAKEQLTYAANLQLIADEIFSNEESSSERIAYAAMLQRLAAETLVSANRSFA